MIKLGILGSTNGTDLQAIFEAEKTKKLNAKVNVVISNKENSYILKGAQDGKSINSGGMLGVPFQSHCPNKASHIFVNTRVFGTPPHDTMKSRAFLN